LNVGNAGTEMTRRMRQGVPQADGTMAVEPVMDVDDVGRAVLFMANLPLEGNVTTLTIVATKMPYVGRG
jgi:NADP-dependent 3-hydroxy acid dehydrogenase YdfG